MQWSVPVTTNEKDKLPPPWCRERDAAERAREREHLRSMQQREREAIALGFKVRPTIKETKK
jgi:hypothetical protein